MRPALVLATTLALSLTPALASAQDRPVDARPTTTWRSPALFAVGGTMVLAGYATTIPVSFLSETSEAGMLPMFGGYIGGAFALMHAGDPARAADASRLSTLGYVQIAASAVQTVGLVLMLIGLRPERQAPTPAAPTAWLRDTAPRAAHRSPVRWMFSPVASSQSVGASLYLEAF
ncbi:MAG: hypothetical protein WCJ30_06660 [Deltaproteobacteria bacterium]